MNDLPLWAGILIAIVGVILCMFIASLGAHCMMDEESKLGKGNLDKYAKG